MPTTMKESNMSFNNSRVGYVVKRYPRYSETFIVNELLAHQAAGLPVEIFALHPSTDSHFQDVISRVRAPVNYLSADGLKLADFWEAMQQACGRYSGFTDMLNWAQRDRARTVYQAYLLASAVVEKGISHLHAHFGTASTSVARLAARLAEIPYSFTAHAKDIYHDSVDPDDMRAKMRDAAAVITVSEFNRIYLQKHYGADPTGIHRVYNGMDLGRLTYQPSQQRQPLIVGIGRLVEKKGFADLIEACRILADLGTPFRCQIIGKGDQENALRAQIERLSIGEYVEMSGPLPQKEVFRLVQEAAVVAAPCIIGDDNDRDGMPTVILEAMALGTPCISTDVTGIPEIIRHEKTGLLVRQNDPAALATALKRLLSDPSLRGQLARQGRELIEADFDIRQNAARMRAIFAAAQPMKPAQKMAVN